MWLLVVPLILLVAAVVQDDAVAGGGHVLGEWPKQLHVLAAALDEQQPRATGAHHGVVEAEPVKCDPGHRFRIGYRRGASAPLRNAASAAGVTPHPPSPSPDLRGRGC